MHIRLNSSDETTRSVRLPDKPGQKIVSVEVIGTSLEPFQFPNISLLVAFNYNNGHTANCAVTFAQAITHGFIQPQGVAIAPVKAIPDWNIQEAIPIEQLKNVTISVRGTGDYDFTVDVEIEYENIPLTKQPDSEQSKN